MDGLQKVAVWNQGSNGTESVGEFYYNPENPDMLFQFHGDSPPDVLLATMH